VKWQSQLLICPRSNLMASIGGVSTSTSTTNLSGIERLISQLMTLERQPVTRMQEQRDELEVRRAVYEDVKARMETVRSSIETLTDTTTGSLYSFGASSSNESIVGVSVGTNPVAGHYDIAVQHLAQKHQLSSVQVSQANEALGWSGTFVIGGAAARSVADKSTVADTVTDFDNAGVRDGETELGSGQYYVEVRHYQDTTWQFRVVDENGDAVRIDDADGAGEEMTGAWQGLNDVAGTTFDTGRGLTITFGSGPYTAGLKGSGAASLAYTAQGASITVDADDSLNNIRDAINNASYAEGNGVVASVVDRRLVLVGDRTGSSAGIAFSDTSGSVLTGNLDLDRRSAGDIQDLASSNGVTNFGIGSLVTFSGGALIGKADLASDRYYVEIGSGDNANKFRLVDGNGQVVAIASKSGGSIATTQWVDISDGSYDTGRGLSITFSGSGTYTATTVGDNAANASYDTALLQSPRDATFSVNGLSVTRGSNTGLNNIIQGLTLDLYATGNSHITVDRDDDATVNGIKSLVGNVNGLLQLLQLKTEPQIDKNSSSDTPTYKRPALSSDYSLKGLRHSLALDLLGTYGAAAEDAPNRLAEIGITLDDDTEDGLMFTVSDESALQEALNENFQGVVDLLEYVLDKIDDRLSPYLDGTSAYITLSQNGIDDQVDMLESRMGSAEARLAVKEEALRKQFQALQWQMYEWQSQSQSMQAFLGSTYSQQS
jgi:flagellar capping protein FliD